MGATMLSAQDDPLSGRTWAKYGIPQTGMYRISGEDASGDGFHFGNSHTCY